MAVPYKVGGIKGKSKSKVVTCYMEQEGGTQLAKKRSLKSLPRNWNMCKGLRKQMQSVSSTKNMFSFTNMDFSHAIF